MVHAATPVENNMGSEVEATSCSKDKGKNVFQNECFYDRLHLSLKNINVFYGITIDLETDKPKMNAELKLMMAEL